MDSLTVGVIFGGRSVEHDVSIVTAHQAMAALEDRHKVVPIYITKEGRWLTAPGLNDLSVYREGRAERAGTECFLAPTPGVGLTLPGGRLKGPTRIDLDVVVPAVHGTNGEDGTVQGVLELADLPYTCSGVAGAAVGMDKVLMKAAFKSAGLPVAEHQVVSTTEIDAAPDLLVERVERSIGFPVFVKPAHLGSSVGIGRAAEVAGLMSALDVARRYDSTIIVERAIEGCIEVNCSVLGGPGYPPRASVCEQPMGWEEFLTFEDKYLRAGKGSAGKGMSGQERRIPAPIPDELTKQVQDNAVTAFNAIQASGVARVDSFVDLDNGQTWVMEINTMPGSFSFYLWDASGLPFPDLMDRLIEIALETHRVKKDLMFVYDSTILAQAPQGKLDRG